MNNFRNLFKNFALVCALILLSFSKGNAQIVYVDLNPDTIVESSNSSVNIDIDNDGTPEFNFFYSITTDINHNLDFRSAVAFLNNDTNSVSGTINGPIFFNSGDTIGSATPWSSFEILNSCIGSSDWNYSLSHFLGVRFLINHQIHYGWIGIIISCGQIIIGDWAYNLQADSSILGSQTFIAGISATSSTSFATVTSFDHSILVHLDENSTATISIYDCLGQLITKKENASGETKMEMKNRNPGIYFVEVVEGEKFYSKKIYLQ